MCVYLPMSMNTPLHCRTHLQAYNMFDMKVTGFTLLTMSMTYATTVGNVDACTFNKQLRIQHTLLTTPTNVSVMMVPDADHVNTSICPGVSNTTYLYTAITSLTVSAYNRYIISTCTLTCIAVLSFQ